jgi:hypothetical protein
VAHDSLELCWRLRPAAPLPEQAGGAGPPALRFQLQYGHRLWPGRWLEVSAPRRPVP